MPFCIIYNDVVIMNIFRLLCVLLSVSATNGVAVNVMPETVSRLNWGVLFNRGVTILNGVTKYRHTFQVKVPRLSYTPIRVMDCHTEYLKLLHCESINELIMSMNDQVAPLVIELNNRINTWLAPIPNVDNMVLSSGSGRKKRSTNLGPDYCDDIKSGDYEADGGGGFLSAVGNFVSSLAGTPTWDDIKIVDKHICDLAEVAELNAKEIVSLGSDFATFSKVANNRMDSIQEGMIVINNRVSETNALLINVTAEIFDAANVINNKILMSVAGTDLLFKMQNRLFTFQSQIDTMTSTVEHFGDGITILLGGRLPPQMVPVETMKDIIGIINAKVTESAVTRLVDINPVLYYMLHNVVFTQSEKLNSLFIMVSFPIYSHGGLMATYRVDRTFISTTEESTSSTWIDNLPDFIAVSPDGLYYTEYSTAEIASCEGSVIKTCKNERALQSFTAMTCAAALYKDDASKIMSLCDIRYGDFMVPSGAVKMSDDTYMIHSSKAGTGAKWTISCPLIPGSATENIDACNACVIQMSCGCEMTAPGEFYIPIQLSGCDETLSSFMPNIKPKFPVNLPVLHAFFDPDVISSITGSTMRASKWKMSIPSLAPQKAQWSQTVEKSNKYSSDLNMLIKETRANRVVYASKATAMLQKATDFTDLKLSNIKTLSDSVANLSWLTDLGTEAGLAGISITVLLPIISCLMSCYVFCRRR